MFFLDRRYGFFTRPARARFSCTVRKLRVRQALGHNGVGIIIFSNGLIGSINGVLWPYAESLLTLRPLNRTILPSMLFNSSRLTCSDCSLPLSLLFYGHPSAPLMTGSNLLYTCTNTKPPIATPRTKKLPSEARPLGRKRTVERTVGMPSRRSTFSRISLGTRELNVGLRGINHRHAPEAIMLTTSPSHLPRLSHCVMTTS
jgi:hypothetical protein